MRAFRAAVLHCLADPGEQSDPSAWEYVDDGLLIVDQGRVVRVGDAVSLLAEAGDSVDVVDYRGKLIVPGTCAVANFVGVDVSTTTCSATVANS